MPLFVPGRPETSRLATILREADAALRMPKGGGSIIDEQGVLLIEDWIRTATTCP